MKRSLAWVGRDIKHLHHAATVIVLILASAIEHLQHDDQTIDQTAVVAALGNFDALWASLFPIEQSRITRLLIDRVTIGTNGIAVDIKTEGIGSIVHDIMGSHKSEHMK